MALSDLDDDPLRQLASWLEVARRAGAVHPEAMALATTAPDGSPSVRMVIMRGLETGLVFFTDRESDKAVDLRSHPRVAALFHWWLPIQRQVRVTGVTADVTSAESDHYWAARPPGSRWNEVASRQSQIVTDRRVLEEAVQEARARFPDEHSIPRPERWGGYRVAPELVEFWQEGSDRIHDRIRYRRTEVGWSIERLSP